MAYDLERDMPLPLEVRPLIAMDGPLQINTIPIEQSIALLKNRCIAVGGCLSVLIHNYSLMNNPMLLFSVAQGLDGIAGG